MHDRTTSRQMNETGGMSPEEARDLELAARLNRELESGRLFDRRNFEDLTKVYLSEQEELLLAAFKDGELATIRPYLEQLPAHFDSQRVLEAFFYWAETHQESISKEGGHFRSAIESLIIFASSPKSFLLVAPLLNDSWISKEICEKSSVRLTSDERTDSSLTEFVYHAFLTYSSENCRILAARFLAQLTIEKLLPSLTQDLDNKELPVATRCLIAEVLGNHPEHELAAEALLSHLFPLPYKNRIECFNANLGKFGLTLAGGIGMGVVGAGLVEVVLPKNPYLMLEVLAVGVLVGTWYSLNKLFKSLNKPRVENQVDEVKQAAAKGLARMLSHPFRMNDGLRNQIFKILELNLDRIKDHKSAGVLRRAMSTANDFEV